MSGPLVYVSFSSNFRNCDFSFGGYTSHVVGSIGQIEKNLNLCPDEFLPDLPDFCAR